MLQCRKGLYVAFLRHGSSVEASSGVCWLRPAARLALLQLQCSGNPGTRETGGSVPRNHADAEPSWTLFVEPGAQKVTGDSNSLGYVLSLSWRRVLP